LINFVLSFKEKNKKSMNDIDAYIQQFPEAVREILQTLRQIILKNAPLVQEKIAYGMPGYYLNKKPLVYFAAFDNHIGFYATPSGHSEFKEELSKYKHGKGSVQFPIDSPLPFDLIESIIRFRVSENQLYKRK